MILVTGGCGYVASTFVLKAIENKREVVVFDNFSTGNRNIASSLKKAGVKAIVEGDLNNPGDLDRLFASYKFSAVVHFAAFSQVGESMTDPMKYWHNNVGGTMNLLSAMLKAGVKQIVFSSTAATYGEPEKVPINEDSPLKPINTYGWTKLTIEKMMDTLDSQGLRSVRFRYFNVSGADSLGRVGEMHDPETHLIPNILKSVGSGKEFKLFGTDYPTPDGTCVRDYIDVEDLAAAHLLALEYLEKGGETDVFNLGTQKGSSNREVFAVCEKVTGQKIPLKECPRRPGDPAVLVASSEKAKRVLGWKPQYSLEDSVLKAWKWQNSLQK